MRISDWSSDVCSSDLSGCSGQVPQGRLMMPAAKPFPGAGTAVDYDPFADGALARVVPTTEPQREIWLADELGRDASLAFNESVTMRLKGRLDAAALDRKSTRLNSSH